jgi:hypothetical protein
VKDMPNPGQGEANVTPNYHWTFASKVTVEKGTLLEPSEIIPNVDLKFFIWTPGGLTVTKGQYPQGVVVLNENARPDSGEMITTKDIPNFILIIPPGISHYVDMMENVGWPCGWIVLWD